MLTEDDPQEGTNATVTGGPKLALNRAAIAVRVARKQPLEQRASALHERQFLAISFSPTITIWACGVMMSSETTTILSSTN